MDIVILILISALHTSPTLTISTHHVRAIAPHDYYRNAPLPPDKTNWEVGLKEATYQALLREQISDPHLKEEIYASNIEGYQDSASPFGDIAIIARGQLYSNPNGYQFVQDPYQNDCDDCHTPHRCDRRQCEPQTNQNLDTLVALWTVKRIRHRDPKFGHRYELQFTISPMSPAANAHFVTRNGRFDYSTPGHVFIVKLKEDGAETRLDNARSNFKFDKEHRSILKELKTPRMHHHRPIASNEAEIVHHKEQTQNYYHNTPNSILLNTGEYYIAQKEKPSPQDHGFNPGFLIGINANGYKHVLHDIPNYRNNGPYTDNKNFVSLHDPTAKEPVKHYHHHFYIPEVEDIDYEQKIVRPVVPTVVTPSTKDPHQFVTGFRPTIPHKFFLTTQQNSADTTPKHVYTSDTTQMVPPLTAYRTFNYPETTVPISISPTIFTEPSYVENPTYPGTTLMNVFTVPATHATQPTPFSPSPFYVQYSDSDPIYSNNQPPTVPTFVTQTIQSTVEPTGTTFYTIQDGTEQPKTQTLVGIFEEIPSSPPTTPATMIATKKMSYHDSINSQLPPPEKGSDTTVPYVPSTAVTILSTSGTESDENDAESSDRKLTTIQDAIQTTTVDSKTEHFNTKPTIKSKTIFESTSGTAPTSLEESTTLTSSTDKLMTTTVATTLKKRPSKNSSEDIFGTANIPKKPKSKVIYSDEFDIFGGSKKSKDITTESIKTRETITTNKKPSAYDKIFGEFKSTTEKTKFLTPHTSLTVSPDSALRNARISKYLKFKRNKSDRLSKFRANKEAEMATEKLETNVTDLASDRSDIETKTSQSLITSISFKVNKNKQNATHTPTVLQDEAKNVIKADMVEINKNSTNLPDNIKTTTDRSQTFDDVAQTLVNHAKVATFLNSRTTKPTKLTYTPSVR